MAAFTEHKVELCRVLDALGHYLQAKVTAEADDRLADRTLFVVVRDAANKTFIQLEDVQRKACEISKGGVTGAKVVQRQQHAKAGQFVQTGQCVHIIIH
ncbi:hypothetical protein D3C85_1675430 [compost metagenome]